MKNTFTLPWTIANALGLSLGFLAFIQTLMFYSFGLNFDLHWDFDAPGNPDKGSGYIIRGLALGLTVFGVVFTAFQAFVLRRYLPTTWRWILSGLLGFALVVLIIWPFAEIWGHIPGPVEPFVVVFSGSLLTLIFQWRYLRTHGIAPLKPFIWYVVGVVVGLIFTLALMYFLIWIGMKFTWAMDVAIIGLIVGGSAGYFSAKHFKMALDTKKL